MLRVNNIYGMYRAAASGLGIAALPDYMGRLADRLVPILPDREGPTYNAYFVYPEELRHSKRVAVLRDYLLMTIERDRKREAAGKRIGSTVQSVPGRDAGQ